MLNLDRDILFQIFEKLQDDRNSLHNSLLVNVSWCEIIVPILWKNPWKCFSTHGKISRRNLQTHLLNDEKKKKLLLDVIISHLSDETSDTFGLTTKYKKPLFNYIGFCKHLNLGDLEGIINIMECKKLGVYDKIINLFINENTRITHLYIPHKFKHKLHLIPGAESCLLRLEYLQCSTLTEDDVLVGLAEISESIEELNLNIYGLQDNYYNVNNNGIIKLIQCQKKLNNVRFYYAGTNYPYMEINSNSFYKDLENSLIKHASNIQYFSTNKKPYPNFLSYFKNLKYLEMSDDYTLNTVHNQMIIKAIYENCPNVEYLEIPFNNNCILEFENLLVKCQYLDSLYLTIEEEDCENLFETLGKHSPEGLFKFKFKLRTNLIRGIRRISLISFKSFFHYWKGKHPMLLQTIGMSLNKSVDYSDLIDTYKLMGVIKKYDDVEIEPFITEYSSFL